MKQKARTNGLKDEVRDTQMKRNEAEGIMMEGAGGDKLLELRRGLKKRKESSPGKFLLSLLVCGASIIRGTARLGWCNTASFSVWLGCCSGYN